MLTSVARSAVVALDGNSSPWVLAGGHSTIRRPGMTGQLCPAVLVVVAGEFPWAAKVRHAQCSAGSDRAGMRGASCRSRGSGLGESISVVILWNLLGVPFGVPSGRSLSLPNMPG